MISRKTLSLALLLVGLSANWPRSAHADDAVRSEEPRAPSHAPTPENDRTPKTSPNRAVAVPIAALPGAVVHGAGHFALGRPAIARRLLLMEGLGLGMFLGGGAAIVFTGASRYVTGPAAATTAIGAGLFLSSWFADIYGTAATEGDASLSRYRPPPWVETELGYRYIYDPQFAYRHFATQKLSIWTHGFRFEPSAFFSLEADNARYEFDLTRRLAGAVPGERSDSASFLDLGFGILHHRYRPEHFTLSGIELLMSGRYDLGGLGDTLRGSFFDFGTGIALQRVDYNLRGVNVPADHEDLLLAHFGFGVLLRGPSKPGSEVVLYYDHRHDDFAAGLKMTGLGSGPLGHFGTRLRYYFDQSFGLLLEAQAGSAYVTGASLIFREGVPP